MVEKPEPRRGRPITNRVEKISASAEEVARALFRAADKKVPKVKPIKKKSD